MLWFWTGVNNGSRRLKCIDVIPARCNYCTKSQKRSTSVCYSPLCEVSSRCSRWRRVWEPCCELWEYFAVFRMFYFYFYFFCVLDVVSITTSFWMPVDCSQARLQNPLSGPRNRGNAADTEKEERELAFSSVWDAVLSDLLSQQFCWLTFSHWILYRNISEQETTHPDAAFIITGDFNKANFRTIAPKYFQHITINTRGDRVLDHCYTSFQDTYKSLPRQPFGKSNHSSVLLLPVYRQKLKREVPAHRDNSMLVGPIGRYTTGLFWSRGLGHVPGSVWWRHGGVFRYDHVFH